MIGYLKGKVIRKGETEVVIDVNGVGYKVFLDSNTCSTVNFNDILELDIYTHVKEDQLSLFGFSTNESKNFFELLISVSGVGPKSALAILSLGNTINTIRSIQKAKVEDLTRVPGIGKKLAQKIIVDLQSKVGKLVEIDLTADSDDELILALINLGFEKSEALKMSKDVDPELNISDKIKISLKKKNNDKSR
jgi:Holliday junction DNA helicase RuvA